MKRHSFEKRLLIQIKHPHTNFEQIKVPKSGQLQKQAVFKHESLFEKVHLQECLPNF